MTYIGPDQELFELANLGVAELGSVASFADAVGVTSRSILRILNKEGRTRPGTAAKIRSACSVLLQPEGDKPLSWFGARKAEPETLNPEWIRWVMSNPIILQAAEIELELSRRQLRAAGSRPITSELLCRFMSFDERLRTAMQPTILEPNGSVPPHLLLKASRIRERKFARVERLAFGG